jgi:hypothetical protein
MRNLLIWIVGFFVLIIVAGKIPKDEMGWRYVDLAMLMVWISAGFLMTIRYLYRFVTR